MNADRNQAKAVFLEAVEKYQPDQWPAFLDQACAGQPELRGRVWVLLEAHREGGTGAHQANAEGLAPATADGRGTVEQQGTVIGPYKLLQQIGEGGMGTVWMAEQTEPVKRLVAVKLIKPGMDSKQVLARFEAERQALALMDHPNIAKVHDAGAASDGRPFFVMELVKGVSLTEYCDEHRLTPRQRLELFVPVCQAIQHAHQKGIIHRDIKPGNVLVARYDDRPVPKVIDFGVAKATGQQLTDQSLHTGFGAVVGTVEYMSPEQAGLNQLDVDTRSDIYSLGILLYELLAGSPPFSRKDLEKAGVLEMLRVIREQEPSKPSTKLSTADGLPTLAANRGTEPKRLTALVRGELDWIVMKALEKDRGRRYETANAFAADIQRYLTDEPIQACPPSAGYRLRKFARRNRRGLTIAALILCFLCLLGAGAGWLVGDRAVRHARLTEDLRVTLERAEFFHGDGKRAEALAAYERAASLADQIGLETPERQRLAALKERLDADARDQEFIARFDEIRLVEQSRVIELENKFAMKSAVPKFEELLQQHGIEVGLTPLTLAVGRIQGRPEAVQAHFLAALHQCLIFTPQAGGPKSQWLIAVLNAADSDSWRTAVRKAWDGRDLNRLEQLANEVDVRKQPPSFLIWMAQRLTAANGLTRLEMLHRIQRAYPGDFWANHELGLALRKAGLPAQALRYYAAALALRPQNPGVLLNYSNALHAAGEPELIIENLRQAITIAPAYASAQYGLGNALRVKRQIDEAIVAYREAIALKPDYAYAHWNLGLVLMRDKKEFTLALVHLRRGFELGKGMPNWPEPTGKNIKECERLIESEAKVARVLAGEEAADAKEKLALAAFCYSALCFEAEARLYEEALRADSDLSAELKNEYLVRAASAAAQAAAGGGRDASALTDKQRERRRQQAVDWLRARLEQHVRAAEDAKPVERASIAKLIQSWLSQPALKSVRDDEYLAKLPAGERETCVTFWTDVRKLLDQLQAKEAATPGK